MAVAICASLIAMPARADLFGADIPLLGGLVTQTVQSVQHLAETVSTLRKSYEEAKRLAGYADDAYRSFEHFKDYTAEMFVRDAVLGFETAYPDISYFRREASGAGPWAQGSGELQRLVRLCVGGADAACGEFREAVSYRQTRDALEETFGPAPPGAYDLTAVDHESAAALAAGSAQEGKSEKARLVSDALRRHCNGLGASSLAACQAAAATAEIEALKLHADTADQIAAGNRIMAMQLQLHNQARKRELNEAEERRRVLLESAQQALKRPVPVEADGFNVVESPP
jgi:hypothetical protein